jgi:NSS family neurotransmitter:Na+ symporter
MVSQRENWESRTSFILAAIGSAIGLGNIWRFPYVCYENGGGAFLVAYIIALLTAGIPLLILEFGIGHKTAGASPKAMKKIHPKLEWFGWFAVGVGFFICTYYAVIMSYCVNYLCYSFNLSWGNDPSDFFFNKVVGITTEADHPWKMGRLMPAILIGLAVSWVWIVLSIWKGTKTVGKVVYATVFIPWLILIIFIIRGTTLPGASEGLKFYLLPDFSALLNPKVWLRAYTQVFFSLSVGFGIMVAYASFLPRKSDITKNALIIGFSDAFTAIAGGFAVFGALGYKAYLSNVPVSEVVRSGPGLTFVTYPEIINKLPVAPVFGVLFFLMLLTLAIDSAFSLVEAVAASTMDKWGWTHRRANLTVAFLAFFLGVPLTFGAGLHWLDIVDNFMNQFGISIVVLGECLVIAFILKSRTMREYVNQLSEVRIGKWWDFCAIIITPASILFLLGTEIAARIKAPYGDFKLRSQEFVFGWLVVIIIFLAGYILARVKGKEPSSVDDSV